MQVSNNKAELWQLEAEKNSPHSFIFKCNWQRLQKRHKLLNKREEIRNKKVKWKQCWKCWLQCLFQLQCIFSMLFVLPACWDLSLPLAKLISEKKETLTLKIIIIHINNIRVFPETMSNVAKRKKKTQKWCNIPLLGTVKTLCLSHVMWGGPLNWSAMFWADTLTAL